MPVNNLNPQGEVNCLTFHNDWEDLGLLFFLTTLFARCSTEFRATVQFFHYSGMKLFFVVSLNFVFRELCSIRSQHSIK